MYPLTMLEESSPDSRYSIHGILIQCYLINNKLNCFMFCAKIRRICTFYTNIKPVQTDVLIASS